MMGNLQSCRNLMAQALAQTSNDHGFGGGTEGALVLEKRFRIPLRAHRLYEAHDLPILR